MTTQTYKVVFTHFLIIIFPSNKIRINKMGAIQNTGLNSKAFSILKLRTQIHARVMPQLGQGILKKFLKIHLISKKYIPITIVIINPHEMRLFLNLDVFIVTP